MANPPHAPTDKSRAEVAALYSYGIPQQEIASFIGIDTKTLRTPTVAFWQRSPHGANRTASRTKVSRLAASKKAPQAVATQASKR